MALRTQQVLAVLAYRLDKPLIKLSAIDHDLSGWLDATLQTPVIGSIGRDEVHAGVALGANLVLVISQ